MYSDRDLLQELETATHNVNELIKGFKHHDNVLVNVLVQNSNLIDLYRKQNIELQLINKKLARLEKLVEKATDKNQQ
jgi:hypothetical protein